MDVNEKIAQAAIQTAIRHEISADTLDSYLYDIKSATRSMCILYSSGIAILSIILVFINLMLKLSFKYLLIFVILCLIVALVKCLVTLLRITIVSEKALKNYYYGGKL